MRRLQTTSALFAFLALLTGGFVLSTPQVAYAACGFGSAFGSASNPTVTSDSAETFTPSTANLFASITNLGSAGSCRGYLITTSTSPWTVPSDWTNSGATVELLGAGGNGGNSGGHNVGAYGGAGGEYRVAASLSYTSGQTKSFAVGAGGAQTDTTWDSSAVVAGAGGNGTGSAAGLATTGSGGSANAAGGNGAGPASGGSGGGGGGAGGPNGIGSNGGGSQQLDGGDADGSTVSAPNTTPGVNGNSGTEWDATHGCGTGADAGDSGTTTGGSGGAYGGAGAGGFNRGSGGTGGNGLIIITYAPSASVTQHGFAYSTDSTLSTGVSTTTLGSQSGTGRFTSPLTGLSQNTTYYYRAYATNGSGTAYGSILSFTTGNTTPTRHIRLFEGYRIELMPGGRFRLI